MGSVCSSRYLSHFVCCAATLYLTQTRKVEFGAALEIDNPILFLEHVSELRVAVCKHALILEQHRGEGLESLVEFFLATYAISVTP